MVEFIFFTLIAKICANYNALRRCLFYLLFGVGKSKKQITNYTNFLMTEIFLVINNFYCNSFSFNLGVIISVSIPGLIYIKGIKESIINKKTITSGTVVVILTIMGFTNVFLTINKIREKDI